MATARQNLNSQLDQDLILKLRAIISSDIHDFDKLNDEDKKTLYVASSTAGYKTNLELWLYLDEHPEAIGLPPLSPKVVEQATVDAHLLAALTAEFETDKLEEKLDATFKDRSEKDRVRIRQILLIMVRREQARLLAAKTDPKKQVLIDSIHHQADPKQDSYSSIRQTAAAIIAASIPQTNLGYTQEQTNEAISTLVTASITGLYDPSDTDSTNTAIQVALSSNEGYQTDVTLVVHQIEDNLTFTPTPNYQSSAFTQVTPNISATLDKIVLPPTEIDPIKAGLSLPLPLQDQAEKAGELAEKFGDKIITNPSTQLVLADLNNNITQEQEKELTAILIAENLLARIAPTKDGATAAVAIATLNPTNPLVDAPTIRIASMGLDLKKLDQHLVQKPDSKLASFIHEHPQVLIRLKTGFYHLEKPENDLGKEVSQRLRIHAAETGTLPPHIPQPSKPGPLTGIVTQYQTITNKISGLLSGRAGQIFNVVAHPIQFIQSKIGSFVGKQIAGKFKTYLIEKVGATIANESLKRAAQFVLKEGLQKGLEKVASFAIAKIGGTALVAGISAALGISTGGVSLVIQAAVMAAMWVGEKTLGLVKNIANGLARAMTGEDFDWKPIAAAPLLLLGGAGGILGGLGAATSIAAMSAGVTLVISTIVGFFFYITVITIAPIISTIAQLDSGLGAASGGTAENFVPIPGISCGATLPPENNTTSNPVAKRAYDVVTKLNKGFWNYCNNHPDYPELFNTQLFKLNPNPPYPGPIQNSAANLFWCTWLTTKAYGFAPGNSFAADGQMRGVNFQDIAGLSYTAVQPGDIIFINVNKSSRVANHVGVVYSVNEDAIVYLQSNAATKTANVPVRTDGTIQDEIGRIAIIGFGRP